MLWSEWEAMDYGIVLLPGNVKNNSCICCLQTVNIVLEITVGHAFLKSDSCLN